MFIVKYSALLHMTENIRTERSEQIDQTQIKLLLKKQPDPGLHCLSLHMLLLDSVLFYPITLEGHWDTTPHHTTPLLDYCIVKSN